MYLPCKAHKLDSSNELVATNQNIGKRYSKYLQLSPSFQSSSSLQLAKQNQKTQVGVTINRDDILNWFFSLRLQDRRSILSIENPWLSGLIYKLYSIYKNKKYITFSFINDQESYNNQKYMYLNNNAENQYKNKCFQNIFFNNSETLENLESVYLPGEYNIISTGSDNLSYYHYNTEKYKYESILINDIKLLVYKSSEIISLDESIITDMNEFTKLCRIISGDMFLSSPCDCKSPNGINKFYTFSLPSWIKENFSLGEFLLASFEQILQVKYVLYKSNQIKYIEENRCFESNDKVISEFFISSVVREFYIEKRNIVSYIEKELFNDSLKPKISSRSSFVNEICERKKNLFEKEISVKALIEEINKMTSNDKFIYSQNSNNYEEYDLEKCMISSKSNMDEFSDYSKKFCNLFSTLDSDSFIDLLCFTQLHSFKSFDQILSKEIFERILNISQSKSAHDLIEECEKMKDNYIHLSKEKEKKGKKKKKKNEKEDEDANNKYEENEKEKKKDFNTIRNVSNMKEKVKKSKFSFISKKQNEVKQVEKVINIENEEKIEHKDKVISNINDINEDIYNKVNTPNKEESNKSFTSHISINTSSSNKTINKFQVFNFEMSILNDTSKKEPDPEEKVEENNKSTPLKIYNNYIFINENKESQAIKNNSYSTSTINYINPLSQIGINFNKTENSFHEIDRKISILSHQSNNNDETYFNSNENHSMTQNYNDYMKNSNSYEDYVKINESCKENRLFNTYTYNSNYNMYNNNSFMNNINNKYKNLTGDYENNNTDQDNYNDRNYSYNYKNNQNNYNNQYYPNYYQSQLNRNYNQNISFNQNQSQYYNHNQFHQSAKIFHTFNSYIYYININPSFNLITNTTYNNQYSQFPFNKDILFFNKLHMDILDYANSIQLLNSMSKQYKNQIISTIKSCLIEKYPSSQIEIYGSFAVNLSIESSDIDLSLSINANESLPTQIINEISILLKEIKGISNIIPIPTATVPLIKFEFLSTQIGKVKIDLTFIDFNKIMKKNNQPKRSVEYIEQEKEKHKEIVPLLLFLKNLLQINKLNSYYNGGLSSFSLFLLILSFIRIYKIKNQCPYNLGSMLFEFLDFYGRLFDYSNYLIDVSQTNPIRYKDQDECPITIIDPITNLNVSKNSVRIEEVKILFERLLIYLNYIKNSKGMNFEKGIVKRIFS